MDAAASATMDIGRGPSTYEVEGPLSSAVRGSPITQPALRSPTSRPALSSPITQSASAVRSADPRGGPIPQPAGLLRNTPTSIRQVWANIGRHDACLPKKAPIPGATRQVVDHSRTPQPPARLRERPAFLLADPGFPPDPVTVSGGVRDFYRRHPRRARAWRTRFQDSSLIHRTAHVTPRSRPVIHRLSTGSSTRTGRAEQGSHRA